MWTSYRIISSLVLYFLKSPPLMYATLSFPSFFPTISQHVTTTPILTFDHTNFHYGKPPNFVGQYPRVSSTWCRARRQIRYDENEDENDKEYGYNEEIAMLEFYSQIAQEALLVKALVDDQENEVLIFKVAYINFNIDVIIYINKCIVIFWLWLMYQDFGFMWCRDSHRAWAQELHLTRQEVFFRHEQ